MTADASLTHPTDWHRRVWRLAVPIMASNVSTPLLGLVDTAVIGHFYATEDLGAVAVGGLIFSFLFWGFGFLRMGTTALAAQAAGAGKGDEVRAVVARALLLAAAIGLLLLLLQAPLRAAALALLGASPAVTEGAEAYFAARIWGAPATLANYAVLGLLLALQRADLALVLQLVLNGVNIVLDLVLVIALGWGVAGVGAASAVAEYVALGVGALLLVRMLPGMGAAFRDGRLADMAAFRRLMAVNRDIFLRTLCLIGGFAWFTTQSARMGDVALAANAVLLNFQTFTGYALDGFAQAAETLVAAAVGARDRAALRQAVRVSTVWAGVAALVFVTAYAAAGPLIIDGLTDIAEVRAAAKAYLPWVVVLPVISVWAFQYDGIFIGATRSAAMRNAMLISLVTFLALCWITVPLWGNHGLWLAFAGFMAMRGLTLGLAYPALVRSV